jgi:hypothetical protein
MVAENKEPEDELKDASTKWILEEANRKVALDIVALAEAVFKDDEPRYNELYDQLQQVGKLKALGAEAFAATPGPRKPHDFADLTQAALMVVTTLALHCTYAPEDDLDDDVESLHMARACDLLGSVELRLRDRPPPPWKQNP